MGNLVAIVKTGQFKDGTKKKVAEISINLIVFLFALFILCWGGIRLVNLTFTLNQISPSLGIPMGYVYLVLPVTGIFIMIYSLNFLFLTLKGKDTDYGKSKYKY